jgi:hypothetical protein
LKFFIKTEDVTHMLGVLKADTHEYTEAIEEVQRRLVLRMIGDYGSHFIYRHAQAAWGRPDWCPRGASRPSLSSCLDNYIPRSFTNLYYPEIQALALEAKEILSFNMTISDCAALLKLVHMRHRFSHTNITEQGNEGEVLETIGAAKSLCHDQWPSDLESFRPLVSKVIEHYEQLVISGFKSQRVELWNGGKFTGHLWAMEKAKRHEMGVGDD